MERNLENSVWVRVGDVAQYIPAPNQGLSMAPTNWGSTTQLVNGSNATVASEYAAREYQLSWSVLTDDDLWSIQQLFAYAGTKPVQYLDRFMTRANAVSPLAGNPHLLAETLSPVSMDASGAVLARSTGDALEFTGRSATDGQSHEYVELVQVPKGYVATGVAFGTNTNRVCWFNDIEMQPNSPVRVTLDGEVARLVVRATSVRATLTGIAVGFSKVGDSPTTPTWTPPAGTTTMRVVPGSFAVTGRNAYNGRYSASVSLQEVWPWL